MSRAGFKLPSWDNLLELQEWTSERSIHFHMDGARLWESRHFYNRSEADIASLFDTVYVSLYKGLGGMGGALLTGGKDFIEECKVWRSRFAGNHYTLFPFLITALDGLNENYAKMEELVERAKEIAKALSEITSLHIAEIQTNGFIVLLDKSLQTSTGELNARIEALSKQLGIHVTNGVTTMPYSEQRILEIQVGANHQDISTDEIVSYFERLLASSTS
ncbi:MAG: hypothetical protein KJO69_10280 [Gammaproteobacteria bacterium]|nr:hypothetical protein [Gammaproteobacteria bacterium]NNJ72319.1 hypothetical protein [Enterobacterales bacterium]